MGIIPEAVDSGLAARPGEGVVKQDGHLHIPCNILLVVSPWKIKEATMNKSGKHLRLYEQTGKLNVIGALQIFFSHLLPYLVCVFSNNNGVGAFRAWIV